MNALQAYVAPAGARRGWWRPIVGVILIGLFWILGTVAILAGWTAYNLFRTGDLDAALQQVGGLMTARDPGAIAIMLSTFVGVWVGVLLAVRLVHRQPFLTLFAPDRRLHVGGFLKGLLLAVFFAGPSAAIALTIAEPVRSELSLGLWALWLGPIAVMVFIQATAEELIFRGYLLQQLAVRSRSMLVWAGIPSIVFGMMHFHSDLPEYGGYYYVAVTFLMGLALAALVWRSGSLWPAAGLHLGVNLLSLTVIGAEGALSGTQLWLFDEADMIPLMQVDLITSVIMLAFVLSPFGRVFGDGQAGPPQEAQVFS